jgi:hypothetical protein
VNFDIKILPDFQPPLWAFRLLSVSSFDFESRIIAAFPAAFMSLTRRGMKPQHVMRRAFRTARRRIFLFAFTSRREINAAFPLYPSVIGTATRPTPKAHGHAEA